MRLFAPLVIALFAACGALTACSRTPSGAVTVSIIGGEARVANPNGRALDAPAMVMTGALMQGLVQFDATGEIEPALAERWMVTDDGLSYIFRIRRSFWSNGQPVSAAQVAQSLRTSLSSASRNPLRPLLGQVVQILPMTETVLEIRLSEPQPGLLALLADPRMAVTRQGRGTGPYRLYRSYPSAKILRPVMSLAESEADDAELKRAERRVRGESAPLAIARYAERNASLVLGGNFADYPLIAAAGIAARDIRIDPVPGLFGLVPARTSGPATNRVVRQALAMSIDRTALLRLFGARGWTPSETLMPGPVDQYVEARPDWADLTLADRKARARALMAQNYGRPLTLRLGLPQGPGARLMAAQLAADWRPLGVDLKLVAQGAFADLQLIDSVAPTTNALWYLHPFACGNAPLCSAATRNALDLAKRATREERAPLYAEADRAIIAEQLYIPIARPLRWSLVAPQLAGFAANATGQHPLNTLAAPRN
ncbi:MAG: ABC transporter substrate-binding protein [Alphaproteobacteria bacterium]|nr:ABC transporter substrate-binding protein [Alphaproteobacteria bacterium]